MRASRLILAALSVGAISLPVSALTTITVDPSATIVSGVSYQTIGAAIGYAETAAADDYLLNIFPTTYNENLAFNSGTNYLGMTLKGNGGVATINGSSSPTMAMGRGGTGASNQLVFDGLSITNSNNAARGFDFSSGSVSYVTLKNTEISGLTNGRAVAIETSTGATVDHLTLGTGTNIHDNLYAVRSGATVNLTNFTIDGATFNNNNMGHMFLNGVGSTNSFANNYDNLTIKNSTFGNLTGGGSVLAMLYLKGGLNDSMDNWVIDNNDFIVTNTTAGTYVDGGTGDTNTAIVLHGRAGDTYNNLTISNNDFINNGGATGALWRGLKINSSVSNEFIDVAYIYGNTFQDLKIGAWSGETGGTDVFIPDANIPTTAIPFNTYNTVGSPNTQNFLVPEPASFGLLALGGLTMLARRRKTA